MNTEAAPTPRTNDSPAPGLRLLLDFLWQSRTRLAIFCAAGFLVLAALLVLVYFVRPSHTEGTLTFRVLFSGVENGHYPNGVRFTPSDIVATSVLKDVYEKNELVKFLGFNDFKSSFAVIENNPALARLQREYQERLGNRSLTPIDRNRLEDEYEDRVRAVRNGEFTLVAILREKQGGWPHTLTGKVMEDILTTWAEQSRARGVFKFDLNIYSANILPSSSEEDDYLIFTDKLRLTITRLLENLDALDKVPGARQVRVGERAVSLGELQASLNDALRYRFALIEGTIMKFGLYRNKSLSSSYIREQMFRLEISKTELQNKARMIQDVHASYTSGRNQSSPAASSGTPAGGQMITQLGDNFLDRVMDLSNKSSDNAFRQSLLNEVVEVGDRIAAVETERKQYERKLGLLDAPPQSASESEDARRWLNTEITQLTSSLLEALNDVQLLHTDVSEKSLQPSSIFTVVEPLRIRSTSVVNMMIVAAMGTVLLICIVGLFSAAMAWKHLTAIGRDSSR